MNTLDRIAQGGVLALDVKQKEEGVCLLSLYVAFDFSQRGNWLAKLGWQVFRYSFPAFVHDVLWNHSLCKLKHLVEVDGEG